MDKQLRHFNRERLKEEASLGIYAIMEESMSRADLARAIGKSRSFVTKVLEGSHNFTLETLADIYAALGRAVHLTLGPDLRDFRLPVDEVAVESARSETHYLELLGASTFQVGQLEIHSVGIGTVSAVPATRRLFEYEPA